MIFKTAKQYYS